MFLKGRLEYDAQGRVCEGSGAQALVEKTEEDPFDPNLSQKAEQQRKRRWRPSRTQCFTMVSKLFRDSGGAARREKGGTAA